MKKIVSKSLSVLTLLFCAGRTEECQGRLAGGLDDSIYLIPQLEEVLTWSIEEKRPDNFWIEASHGQEFEFEFTGDYGKTWSQSLRKACGWL